jgi:hypothetical protein
MKRSAARQMPHVVKVGRGKGLRSYSEPAAALVLACSGPWDLSGES